MNKTFKNFKLVLLSIFAVTSFALFGMENKDITLKGVVNLTDELITLKKAGSLAAADFIEIQPHSAKLLDFRIEHRPREFQGKGIESYTYQLITKGTTMHFMHPEGKYKEFILIIKSDGPEEEIPVL